MVRQYFTKTDFEIKKILHDIILSTAPDCNFVAHTLTSWKEELDSKATLSILKMFKNAIDDGLLNQKLVLKDKNGIELYDKCVIYGSVPNITDEKHYWNLGFSSSDNSFQMIACTFGYIHNVQPFHLVDCVYIGNLEDNLHLLECD